MPHNRFEWIDRLKFVEREHRVVATAIERLLRAILDGQVRTPDGTTPRDLVAAGESLETTYLVRLWAEFETALLSYYRFLRGDPEGRIRAIDLVNYLAGVRRGRAIALAWMPTEGKLANKSARRGSEYPGDFLLCRLGLLSAAWNDT